MRNIDSERFGQEVVTCIGRDLHLPQGKALEVCRRHVAAIIQMYEDGYSVIEVIDFLSKLIEEDTAHDEELRFLLAS